MSETVKLIIEISKDYYEILKSEVEQNLTDYYPFIVIGNGIPLDSVKAKIQAKEMVETNIERQFYNMALDDVTEILDNIGKETK